MTGKRITIAFRRIGSSIVFVHSLSEAVPWLLAVVLSAATGTYGFVEGHGLLLALSVGVGFGAVLTLFIAFANWYLAKRQEGWKQKAEDEEIEKKKVEEELGTQKLASNLTERMGLALKVVHDLNMNPLVITRADSKHKETQAWLTGRFLPAMLRIAPSTGLALLQWSRTEGPNGEYTLNYDADVPEVVRSVLPKVSGREFARCIAALQLRHHRSALLVEESGEETLEWLIAFPEVEFDGAAMAVFSTGARIVHDAWRPLPPARVSVPV